MGRKKLDPRIRTMIENGVKSNHRSMFVIVGDRGRDQVVNLHFMLAKAWPKPLPSVLWCYKKKLGFSSNQRKRMKFQQKIQKRAAKRGKDFDQNPFETFLSSTDIRYTYYKESHAILGQTFGVCVLQDFEALTPNLLARTIETVDGGGLVILLLHTMNSLQQLYTLTMDVHRRYRTESHADVTGRFNERFMLSLGTCKACIVMDDELNVLPVSSHTRFVEPIELPLDAAISRRDTPELKELKGSLAETQIIGPLIKMTITLDQAKAIVTYFDTLSEKTLRMTVVLTAARGRGKSAAMGIAVSAALTLGYSNIYVTAPSPENLKTFFEFLVKGLQSCGYKQHMDYDIVHSTNPEYRKSAVRVNVFHAHRQTVQYIQPQDSQVLSQAELVVIDEAAAIPLPYVKKLMGPYLVFMSSTVNGYEGTGRSLSLKLIRQLREQSSLSSMTIVNPSSGSGRVLKELTLEEPIRYGAGDYIESWLYDLLCLDASTMTRPLKSLPHPSDCQLFYVCRDSLFSYHALSEQFLRQVMGLMVASHYKNSPNDLQLLSDAPAHHMFALVGPVDDDAQLPEVLTVIQVCLEGQISKDVVQASISRGVKASGDLIPWTISEQYQDVDFPSLSGARIVRIAVHPDAVRRKYATRAMTLLTQYYQNEITSIDENEAEPSANEQKPDDNAQPSSTQVSLLTEDVSPRKNLPPLLQSLERRVPEKLHYLGVSYGVNQHLYNFWSASGFLPVYLRLVANDVTGEHSCVMLKKLNIDDPSQFDVSPSKKDWIDGFVNDFRRRFCNLLSYEFCDVSPRLALSVLRSNSSGDCSIETSKKSIVDFTKDEMNLFFSAYDLRRLNAYAQSLVDYHVVLDLVPTMGYLYFTGVLTSEVSLSPVQQVILLGVALQKKKLREIARELGLDVAHIMAHFNKFVRKINKVIQSCFEKFVQSELSLPEESQSAAISESLKPLLEDLDEELEESGQSFLEIRKKKQENLVSSLGSTTYKVGSEAIDDQLAKTAIPAHGVVSVKLQKSLKRHQRKGKDEMQKGSAKKKRKFAKH